MVDMKLKMREAAEFLGRKGRRIEIIFFGLLLVFVTIMPLYLYSYLEYFFGEMYEFIQNYHTFTEIQNDVITIVCLFFAIVCAIAFVAFLTLPIYSCFFDFSYKIYRNGSCGKQKFLGFGKRGYWGAFRAGGIFVFIFALSVAPVVGMVILGKYLVGFDDVRIVTLVNNLFFLMIAMGFVIGFFVLLAFKPFFLFGYYIAKGKKVFEALSLSCKQMKKKSAKEIYFVYFKAFVPSLLLSLATLLVFFIVDTLPKMILVYFDVAEDIVYVEQEI